MLDIITNIMIFPNVPWTKLPALRKLAPDFYENIPQHKSWPLVIWKFITDPRVSSFNRVKRADLQNIKKFPCGDVTSGRDD